MKKNIIAGIVFTCVFTNAQVILTKDLSFGNSGEFIYPDNGGYRTHKFIGDKLLVSYTYLNTSTTNYYYSKFIRLDFNGTPDAVFGNNGSFVDGGSVGMASSMEDANSDYLINSSGNKYFANGQHDDIFQMNWTVNDFTGNIYYKVFPDGKILYRKDNKFSRLLPNGVVDVSYGNNGNVTTLSYSSDFHYGKILNDFVYEFGSGNIFNPNTTGLRKISTLTGALDTGFGTNGLGQTSLLPSVLRNSMFYQGDSSMINMIEENNSGNYELAVSKTNSNGFLDATFGNNGVFPLHKEINTVAYMYYSDFYANNTNKLFFLIKNMDGDINIVCYSFSGAMQTINSQNVFQTGDNTYNNYNYDDYPRIDVVGNYLYFFSPKKITRYIISESSLNTTGSINKFIEIGFNNPFKDELILNTHEKMKEVEIIDESGRVVLKSRTKDINTSGLSEGIYFIKLTTESNKVITKKGIKN
ncbi:T9SS type A sorting domain-containing protein [Chryseobacterium daecheongense]|uniref:T9SS type A sorting domain-containing protein n=1 Tax=Chryseobacterium daecheongense TaxID=192389 RepID=UPI001FD720B2|nr:T9SS type A sorting domain-containing protein [Chryseobacterium daecheongense]UOU97992.1 T9SS type A sorting domain-containing protein [Chryseobacterium daecheongense]